MSPDSYSRTRSTNSRLRRPTHSARGLLAYASLGALVLLGVACGSNVKVPAEPETWMLGTFSASRLGCNTAGFARRYTVHEDGRFEFLEKGPGTRDREWWALWEQSGRGRYRVMRDEAFSDVQFYPIEEGTQWEVTRSTECEDFGYIWHDIDEIELETGERKDKSAMTLGAICSVIDMEVCFDVSNEWCEGTEPPPECDAE